ncbi:hypothetical protein ACTWQL_20830 [Pseudalkalibacillus sp. R45]|uniref:hypothetical protein n=1 Tax=Pseudalkalibacillus sp. R45 TaxID=3457433 RepID=UPI003FCD6AF8
MLLLIVIFILLCLFAPHSEMMHSFKTTRSFVITMLVMLAVCLYFVGAHFNGLHEGEWRISWLHKATINETPVIYAGSKSVVGLVLEEKPKEGVAFESEIITWKSYNELMIEITKKWGGVDPIVLKLTRDTSDTVPFSYPLKMNFS